LYTILNYFCKKNILEIINIKKYLSETATFIDEKKVNERTWGPSF